MCELSNEMANAMLNEDDEKLTEVAEKAMVAIDGGTAEATPEGSSK